MGRYFDHAARKLASGISRREAMRLLGVGMGGLLLPLLKPQRADAEPSLACQEYTEFLCPNLLGPTCCKNGQVCGLLGCGSPL
jgi:hypothetical protein